ncbi:MAG: hypothetical protein IJF92_06240 [Bacilli bacterium]|nr:hypothetical protein [Bacilli bacterium]
MVRAQNRRNIYILIAIITLILIGIGYAFLTGDLNILGNARIEENAWDVRFENIQVESGSVEANTPTITNNTTITYTVNLNTTGDYYEFSVDVANKGTIDAMIDSVNITNLTDDQKKYLTYSVTYYDLGLGLEEKQELKSGKTEKLRVKVAHKKDIKASDLPTEDQSLTLSVSINYVQADDTAISVSYPVCQRATTLHQEICEKSSCGDYSLGDTITYGNIGTEETLSIGDAFDCDVNGDGEYNPTNERFYYMSDLNTNNNYAVMIYYNNVSAGIPNNTFGCTYSEQEYTYKVGPETAVLQLPTVLQWTNVELSNVTRKLKGIPSEYQFISFSYAGYAARLLSYEDMTGSCHVSYYTNYPDRVMNAGTLNNCKHVLENTRYSKSENRVDYWMENPSSSSSNNAYVGKEAWYIASDRIGLYKFLGDSNHGVRPVIEVPKSKIKY